VKVVNCVLEEKIHFYDGNNHLFLSTFKGYTLVSHSYNRKKQYDRREEVETEIQLQQKYRVIYFPVVRSLLSTALASVTKQPEGKQKEGPVSVGF
jgi:hypothetical protein